MAMKIVSFYYCEEAAQFAEVMLVLALWMEVERAPIK